MEGTVKCNVKIQVVTIATGRGRLQKVATLSIQIYEIVS